MALLIHPRRVEPGAHEGVSRERVRQIEAAALRKLRNANLHAALRGLSNSPLASGDPGGRMASRPSRGRSRRAGRGLGGAQGIRRASVLGARPRDHDAVCAGPAEFPQDGSRAVAMNVGKGSDVHEVRASVTGSVAQDSPLFGLLFFGRRFSQKDDAEPAHRQQDQP
jgi:hypothetical protein